METWRGEYNNYRPNSSLGYLILSEFVRRYYEKHQVTEVKQPLEIAGSLSLQVVLKLVASQGAF